LVIAAYVMLHNLTQLIRADFRVPLWVWAIVALEALFLWYSFSVNYDLPGGWL
jgi:hypothetical protein